MTPEALVALTLAGACLILLFWRTLLELLVVCAVFGGLGLIWSADMPPVWLKGVLTVALLAVSGLIAEKLGLRIGEGPPAGPRTASAAATAARCSAASAMARARDRAAPAWCSAGTCPALSVTAAAARHAAAGADADGSSVMPPP
jgi:hypothetical protein